MHQAATPQPAVSQPPQNSQIPQTTMPQSPQFVAPAAQQSVMQQPAVAQPQQPQPEQSVPAAQQPQAVAVAPEPNEEAADEAWVEKARAIAGQYQSDPYAQSKALSKLKADYMLARYGKTVKVAEG